MTIQGFPSRTGTDPIGIDPIYTLSPCPDQFPIPPENLPICLRSTALTVNPPVLTVGWYTVVLTPTHRPGFRVWTIKIAAVAVVSDPATVSTLVFRLKFTGSSVYTIDWEAFPIVGTVTVGNESFIVNSTALQVDGQNAVQNRSLDIRFEFTGSPVVMNPQDLFFAHIDVYDIAKQL